MRNLILGLTAAVLISAPAQAATYRLGGLEVDQPWSRPAAAGTNGAGYMTLTNRGVAPDTLTAVESPAARIVEMHKTSMDGGVMRMQRLDSVLLPPGKAITFAPAGYHIMLIGLAKTQKAGDVVPATLVFSSGARLKIEFAVGAGPTGGAAPMGAMPMDHMNH
ncbi:copper chaperone PCu(A)C [Phenylobacterium sp.]|uniref:copper chaperone PCu(A)C n=1 Tax=Phenylobacterium sp. TaxID=1871053 RepID=UPI00271CC4C7|nr:copper chaperone PCu(A)C [Phenylobacterium sp.]MDO8377724.1 copper chaperone PCu(A)C [Phenylobacterium sp.]